MPDRRDQSDNTVPTHHRVAILGAGFGGIGAAVQLIRRGERDFVVLERGGDVGGTWRDNHYPGCACDVPSHLYSFSFAPKADWSRTFATQPEIYAYLRDTAQRFGVTEHVRFGEEVLDVRYDEAAERWEVRSSGMHITADVVISAVGALSEPSVPELPGIERFAGPAFHTAAWDDAVPLHGKRVAVIGTGASAIQVVPEIAGRVEHLDVFQRTAPWVMPRLDRPIAAWQRTLLRRVPGAQRLLRGWLYWTRELLAVGLMHPRLMTRLERIAREHLRRQVQDPQTREQLTPGFRMGCKRILLSNTYLRAFNRDNVSLVTAGITEVRERSIVTADGDEHPVDVIVYGTGFHVTDLPVAERVRGRDGRSLSEAWHGGISAYKGTTIAGFPNLFMLLGPNTGLGHNSIIFMIESQLRYVMSALRARERDGMHTLEVRPEAQRDYNDALQGRMAGSVWTTGGCASWYLDANGRNTTLWPGFTWPFRRQTANFDRGAYVGRPRRADTPTPSPAPPPEREPALV
jgi:cation diffusion facilitator CzcD-associated flavoprotein CzcO